MRVPLSWLREYVDIDDSVEGLRDVLTFSGLEVEAIETVGSDFAGIVTARILSVAPHPDADRLTLCTVEYGEPEPITVVCGAPNVRPGLNTIYAPVGCTLPNGLKLKKAKIRGVVSLGMLCAEDELGLSSAHEGIMELTGDWQPGTPAVEVLGGPETVFDLEVTPNRPDCLSLLGIARELAALYGGTLRLPPADLTESDSDRVEAAVTVTVQDSQACPRYTARVLRGVQVRPSPEWMQKRLRLCGLRPINNVVDITNYVMLETGQPLHAFDRALLEGGELRIRPAADGEILQTLDGQARALRPDHLVIADGSRPVAVAGVMGGANSEIRDDTETVVLEAAAFAPARIRATARELGMHTDSSHRFARGCDVHQTEWVSRRAAHLLLRHASASLCGGVIDLFPSPTPPRVLTCRWQRVRDVTGIEADDLTIAKVFRKLELEVLSGDCESAQVRIPSFRGDLEREIDLVEEFARVHGLDHIPTPAPRAITVPAADDSPIRAARELRRLLVGMGLHECMHYSLTSPDLLESFAPGEAEERVALPNPISRDQAVLRSSLLPQLAETIARNKARQNHELSLFELGKTFHKDGNGTREVLRLSIGLLGPVGRPALAKRAPVSREEAFAWIKGIVERLLQAADLPGTFTPCSLPAFAPGCAATLSVDGRDIGHLGLLPEDKAQTWRIYEPVAMAELEASPLLPGLFRDRRMQPTPQFPAIVRDLALIVDTGVQHADVMQVIAAQRPPELESVQLFDVFTHKKLGDGKVSLAYSFTYRSHKKTLTDEAALRLHQPLVDRLLRELNAKLPDIAS